MEMYGERLMWVESFKDCYIFKESLQELSGNLGKCLDDFLPLDLDLVSGILFYYGFHLLYRLGSIVQK